jgi:hypothetical protein
MGHLNPEKLHVSFIHGVQTDGPRYPRAYTLTHSDLTGDLYLSIGQATDQRQISGFYTRFMRDEVLAEWSDDEQPCLHVHCHVSGGLVFGSASYREATFRYHMPLVFEAFRLGDRKLIERHPELGQALVSVYLHTRQWKSYQREGWGVLDDFQI